MRALLGYEFVIVDEEDPNFALGFIATLSGKVFIEVNTYNVETGEWLLETRTLLPKYEVARLKEWL